MCSQTKNAEMNEPEITSSMGPARRAGSSALRRKSVAFGAAIIVAATALVSFDSGPAQAWPVDWTHYSATCPEGSIRPGIQTYVTIYSAPLTGPPPPSNYPWEPRIRYFTSVGMFQQNLGVIYGRTTVDVNSFLKGPQDPNQPGQPDTSMMRAHGDNVDVAILIETANIPFSAACVTYINRGGLGDAGAVDGANLQLPPVKEQVVSAGGVP